MTTSRCVPGKSHAFELTMHARLDKGGSLYAHECPCGIIRTSVRERTGARWRESFTVGTGDDAREFDTLKAADAALTRGGGG